MKILMKTILLSLILNSAFGVSFPQEERKSFEAQSYLGFWYDVARTPNDFQDNTPTRHGEELGVCVNSTAEYSLRKADEISLTNTCFRENESGDFIKEDITGRAKFVKGKNATQLKIAFGGVIARFFQRLFTGGGADYWVYAVGEKNAEGLYSWAIVSGEDKDYIFVLSRKPTLDSQIENDILAALRRLELPLEDLVFNRDLK